MGIGSVPLGQKRPQLIEINVEISLRTILQSASSVAECRYNLIKVLELKSNRAAFG